MRAKDDVDIGELIKIAAETAGCATDRVDWWAWPWLFASGSGPLGGVSASALTTFQVYAFRAEGSKGYVQIKHCAGVWRWWNGEVEGRW